MESRSWNQRDKRLIGENVREKERERVSETKRKKNSIREKVADNR